MNRASSTCLHLVRILGGFDGTPSAVIDRGLEESLRASLSLQKIVTYSIVISLVCYANMTKNHAMHERASMTHAVSFDDDSRERFSTSQNMTEEKSSLTISCGGDQKKFGSRDAAI